MCRICWRDFNGDNHEQAAWTSSLRIAAVKNQALVKVRLLSFSLLPTNPLGKDDADYHSSAQERAVKLPCGHIFGEDCILDWAQGITPSGRYNGCPWCRSELLPPTLRSRSSALRWWLTDFWHTLELVIYEHLWILPLVPVLMVADIIFVESYLSPPWIPIPSTVSFSLLLFRAVFKTFGGITLRNGIICTSPMLVSICVGTFIRLQLP